jgi:hypothetical protein
MSSWSGQRFSGHSADEFTSPQLTEIPKVHREGMTEVLPFALGAIYFSEAA